MKKIILGLFLIAILIFTFSCSSKAVDRQSLVGTWKTISMEQNGEPISGFERATIIFKEDNTYSDTSKFSGFDELINSGTYELRGKKIALWMTESNLAINDFGELDISIEGDTLTLTDRNGVVSKLQRR
jgi:hypothetical protein